MAPELLSGEEGMENNTSSDVYAFGCVLYEVQDHLVVKIQGHND